MRGGDYFAAGVVIVVGAVLVVLAFTVWDDGGREYSEVMEYEDYKAVTGSILGVSGPLELVEINGVQYVHATGTGKGAILYENGTADHIKIEKAKADIVLINGQSQAAYFGPLDPEQAIAPEPGQGFYFGWEDEMPSHYEDVDDCRFYDFVDGNGDCRVGDKGPAFSKAWGEITGKKVIWISLGVPGRTVSYWQPETGLLWRQDVKIMTAAVPQIPEGFDIDRTFMIWAQGESDYNKDTGYQHYIQTWRAFYEAAPSAWGVDIGNCYLVEEKTDLVGWVNDAFRELASEDGIDYICEGIAESFTVGNGLVSSDGTHFSQIGDNSMATAYAYHIAKLQGHSTGTAPIYLQETIVRCDVGDSVTLEPVRCYRADGSTTRLETSWASSLDTSTAGIVTVSGTTSAPNLLLEGCPAPLATAYVGYIGLVDGIEYMENSGGGATVIGRDSLTLGSDVDIPSTVEGLAVTAIGDYAFNWGPWKDIDMPDTVTSIGVRTFQSDPLVEALHLSEGLTSIGFHGMTSFTFMEDGEQITVSQYTHDPSLVIGDWAWDGTTPSTLYRVTP